MCNRVRRASRTTIKTTLGNMVTIEADGIDEEIAFGYDRPSMPILVSYPEVKLVEMEWGFLPCQASGNGELQEKLGTLFNARAETIFDKFSFRSAIRLRRCIVMLDGFYEYQHQIDGKKKRKQPFYVSLEDDLLPAAGIWDECDGRKTFAIITTQANPLMATIHNMRERQPHIIEKQDWQRWLGPLTDDEIQAMLEIYPDDKMRAEPWGLDDDPPPPPKDPMSLF
jgi:putative SOS response-associated peptidase YedK